MSARDDFIMKVHQLSRAGGPAWLPFVASFQNYAKELIELAVQRDPPSPLHNGKAAMLIELSSDFQQIEAAFARISTKKK